MSFIENQQLRKIAFYARGFLENTFIPNRVFRQRLSGKLAHLDTLNEARREAIRRRVDYYHQIDLPFDPPSQALSLREVPRKKTSYYLDYRGIMRHFPPEVRVAFRFGDVTEVTDFPRLVKTRPLDLPHENNILMRFNSIRHFRPVHDPVPFRRKKDLIVWRGKCKNSGHRTIPLQKFFHHPDCDFGNSRESTDPQLNQWHKPFMTVAEQLRHKFILSIEGNDVATNLKWISQSNSLCFMTRPKYESWFMEGTLKAGVHYVELRDDYADLPEKLAYFQAAPEEAEEIIRNFKSHHALFADPKTEELVGLLVAQKYLTLSGQLSE